MGHPKANSIQLHRLYVSDETPAMHASKYHINTLKAAPAEAEVRSHKLMTRAGMLRKVAGGIYTYMPLGLRVIQKLESIVREEMKKANAKELLIPVVKPAELWTE